jgi:UDP-N-acetylmuramoylalanine--D-glutamate ligase
VNGELNFADKRIVILGLARQGLALARFFVARGASVVVSDRAQRAALGEAVDALADLPVELALGGHPLSLLDGCDLLCLSGGVPPQIELVQTAIARGVPLSNDSLLTMQAARRRGLGPVVGVTGSSGKTTTTTLIGEMLATQGLSPHVGGNIGHPLIDRLDEMAPGEPLVLELSSFQLELFDPALSWGPIAGGGPDVAAILNVTPNHLDRHADMAEYAAAKFNLVRSMPRGATLVLDADDAVTGWLLDDPNAPPLPAEWALEPLLAEIREVIRVNELRLIPFSRSRTLTVGAWLDGSRLVLDGKVFCHRKNVRLRGDHNISNLLAAAAVSDALGVSKAAIGDVARTFEGVPHRLEVVATADGVTWINDSIATSPERAMAALRSFQVNDHTLILLAGGKDKNLPWTEFADEVIDRVRMLIGFGDAGPMIVRTVQDRADETRRQPPNCAVVKRLDEAVDLARRVADGSTVVLLSPGGTSFDAYKDFAARGEHFRALVERITRKAVSAAAMERNW